MQKQPQATAMLGTCAGFLQTEYANVPPAQTLVQAIPTLAAVPIIIGGGVVMAHGYYIMTVATVIHLLPVLKVVVNAITLPVNHTGVVV